MNELVSDRAFQALAQNARWTVRSPLEQAFSPCVLLEAAASAHLLIRHLRRSRTGYFPFYWHLPREDILTLAGR